ncbi:MAG TPA: hypothetical protein VGC04_04580 [Cellulomonas sp.]
MGTRRTGNGVPRAGTTGTDAVGAAVEDAAGSDADTPPGAGGAEAGTGAHAVRREVGSDGADEGVAAGDPNAGRSGTDEWPAEDEGEGEDEGAGEDEGEDGRSGATG